MKKKTIWFINKDAAPIEFYGTHLRTIKLAQYFQSEGYNVKLFCSSMFTIETYVCLTLIRHLKRKLMIISLLF